MGKPSKKQQQFKRDTVALQATLNHLEKVVLVAPEGRERRENQNGSVSVKSPRMKRSKWTLPPKEGEKRRQKVNGFRVKVDIKDLNKTHTYRVNDQNLGYVKQKRYGRFTTNQKTPGRGIAVIVQKPIISVIQYDEDGLNAPYIDHEE